LQGSVSEKAMQFEQSLMELCSSPSAAAISRASEAGFRRMVKASLVAVFAPMPGSDEKLLTSRSRAGGITWISPMMSKTYW